MSYWIVYGNEKIGCSVRCSKCGDDFGDALWLTDYFYCPSCGEKMESEEGDVE